MHISKYNVGYETGALPQVNLPSPLTAEVVKTKVVSSGILRAEIDPNSVHDIAEQEQHALVWLLAEYSRYGAGKTYRQIVPLGASGVGQVVFRYDKERNGTATLVGRGVPLSTAEAGIGQLQQDITQKYAVTITGNWSAVELTKLRRALSLVPDADLDAVRGLEIARVDSLQTTVHNGYVLAVFEYGLAPHITSLGKISVANKAFEGDDKGFHGSGAQVYPPSVRTILHEVGHAVESAPPRIDAWNNTKLTVEGRQPGTVKGYGPISQALIDDAIQLRYQNFVEIGKVQSLAVNAYNAVQQNSPQAAGLISECEKAGGKLTTLAEHLKKMKKEAASASAASDLVDAVSAEYQALTRLYNWGKKLIVGEFKTHEYADLKREAQAMPADTPWRPFYEELIRWCDIKLRRITWNETHTGREQNRTGREQNFVHYANANSIDVELTNYSKSYWSTVDKYGREFYAEAYSYWLVHPDALKAHHSALLGYFLKGSHRDNS
ncbi:hypothetical protein [Nonomuraea sp. NPDC049158]|uniref:hypothetical protein n=1 Tax=Nonomuraea sp. NPDC049158 TaxID=3155649 RepID=UPI0033CD9779